MKDSHLFNSHNIKPTPHNKDYVLDLTYELREMKLHRAEEAIQNECARIDKLMAFHKNSFKLWKLNFEIILKELEIFELLPLNLYTSVYDYEIWLENEKIFHSRISKVKWKQINPHPLRELENKFGSKKKIPVNKETVTNLFYSLNASHNTCNKYFRMYNECVDIQAKILNTPYNFFPKGKDEHKKNRPWIRENWYQIRQTKSSDNQADIKLMAKYEDKFGYTISKRTIERYTDRG